MKDQNGLVIKLDWDSDFFGHEVGVCELKQGYDKVSFNNLNPTLLYVFADSIIEDPSTFIEGYSGKLLDQKITFESAINYTEANFEDILEVNQFSEKLLSLALDSGEYSRFKLDENITSQKFEQFYSEWLSNSLKGSIADKVFVFRKNKIDLGLITVAKKPISAQIGLLSVCQTAQRRGIGKKLMQRAESWAIEVGAKKMRVVTQKDNINACNFYRSLKYHDVGLEYVYHFWKQ